MNKYKRNDVTAIDSTVEPIIEQVVATSLHFKETKNGYHIYNADGLKNSIWFPVSIFANGAPAVMTVDATFSLVPRKTPVKLTAEQKVEAKVKTDAEAKATFEAAVAAGVTAKLAEMGQ